MDITELEELERRGWQALSGPHGAAFYEEIMADDGLMVFPGTILNKAASIEAIKGAAPWARFELVDTRIIRPTPDTALVVYRATAARADAAPYRALMTSAYCRRDGHWQLVLHQQTPAP